METLRQAQDAHAVAFGIRRESRAAGYKLTHS